MKRKTLVLFLLGLLSLALCGCGSRSKSTKDTGTEAGSNREAESGTDVETANEESGRESKDEKEEASGPVALIDVKDYGQIRVELDEDSAPLTTANFIKLARSGFYDGLTFHRIMDGFMIQGGDPEGTGRGGSDETIQGEFSANGVDNPISHVRGTISMARSQDYDSARSQFFIVQTDSVFLDGQYAGFGTVTEGMEVVDAICKDAEPVDDNGTIPADQQPVIRTITIEE